MSGESHAKTGSTLARHPLVESAWPYSRLPRLGATLANRQAGQNTWGWEPVRSGDYRACYERRYGRALG